MDVLAELLPPAYLIKSENAEKDRKQKTRHYRQKKLQTPDELSGKEPIQMAQISNWDDVERRSGKDRREQMEGRGRWLESREAKDRRQIAKRIQIKI